MWYVFKISFPQKFPNHKTLEGPETTEVVLENLYPNTIYHVWVAAKSRRGEGAATPKLAVRTEQYGKSYSSRLFFARRKKLFIHRKNFSQLPTRSWDQERYSDVRWNLNIFMRVGVICANSIETGVIQIVGSAPCFDDKWIDTCCCPTSCTQIGIHTFYISHLSTPPLSLCAKCQPKVITPIWKVMLPMNLNWQMNIVELNKDPTEFFEHSAKFSMSYSESDIWRLTSNLVPDAQPNILRTAYDRDVSSNAQSSIRRGVNLKAHLNTKVPRVPDQVPWVPSGLFLSFTTVLTSDQSLLSFCYHQQQHYPTTINANDNKYWCSLEKVKFRCQTFWF